MVVHITPAQNAGQLRTRGFAYYPHEVRPATYAKIAHNLLEIIADRENREKFFFEPSVGRLGDEQRMGLYYLEDDAMRPVQGLDAAASGDIVFEYSGILELKLQERNVADRYGNFINACKQITNDMLSIASLLAPFLGPKQERQAPGETDRSLAKYIDRERTSLLVTLQNGMATRSTQVRYLPGFLSFVLQPPVGFTVFTKQRGRCKLGEIPQQIPVIVGKEFHIMTSGTLDMLGRYRIAPVELPRNGHVSFISTVYLDFSKLEEPATWYAYGGANQLRIDQEKFILVD